MPILQAIVDSKTIQHQTINREWYDTNVKSGGIVMAWVATNANGLEFLFIEKPYRSGYGEYGYWNPIYSSIGGCILIPHGSIKKLIGRELSFSDEPVELK